MREIKQNEIQKEAMDKLIGKYEEDTRNMRITII